MQCPYCGLNNVPGASFCKNCGKSLVAQPTTPPQAYLQNPPPPAMAGNYPPPYAQQNPAPPNMPPYAPPSSQNPQVQQANWGAPIPWNASPAQPALPVASIRRIHKISAVSVLKVVAAIYGLMYAVFGFLFIVLPGVFGAGLLDIVGLRFGGGSILALLLIYVLSVAVAALSAGVIAAIGALIYNLVVRYIGGIEVEVA